MCKILSYSDSLMQALFVVGQPLGSLEIAAKGWKVGMVECWNGGWTFSVFQSSNIPETRPPDITDKLIPEAPIDRPITLADYPGLPVFNGVRMAEVLYSAR